MHRDGDVSPSAAPRGPGPAGTSRPLALRPLRGLRFDPAVVGDLATVVSPPYDVLDADTVRVLEAANPHNIVRLILSRHFERPYRAVLDRLERWRAGGVLRPDPTPMLYLYEYTADGTTVRGLVGLLELREEAEGVVLPHEDVMPGPVDDRVVLMRTTRTNLEPILLVHEGTDRLRALIRAAADASTLADFAALDGSRHRLWGVPDPADHAAIAEALAGGTAVIADGHHRYAAYLRLQREQDAGTRSSRPSPWDFGLAMLVDARDHPLGIGPIHRVVASMTMADVRELAQARGDAWQETVGRATALAASAQVDAVREAAFVVTDGTAWAVLRVPRSHAVDAGVLHETVLPGWHVAEAQVSYHHGLDQALHALARSPGVVVVVRPPTLDEVARAAAAGVRLPRKSTSFSPKPRMGVVMRDLRDG